MLVVCANACTIKMHENVSFLLWGCEIRITFAVEKNNKDKAQKVNKDDSYSQIIHLGSQIKGFIGYLGFRLNLDFIDERFLKVLCEQFYVAPVCISYGCQLLFQVINDCFGSVGVFLNTQKYAAQSVLYFLFV